MDSITVMISDIDPALAFICGLAIGICATLGIRNWSFTPHQKADPLSGLFARDTLNNQLSQIADRDAVSERKDREASAFRAKMFARSAAQAPEKTDVPPHRAERYDHAAVLAHVAKVMRAGTDLGKDDAQLRSVTQASEWEEVLLLPPPADSVNEGAAAKAA